jgi:hypothetical protein
MRKAPLPSRQYSLISPLLLTKRKEEQMVFVRTFAFIVISFILKIVYRSIFVIFTNEMAINQMANTNEGFYGIQTVSWLQNSYWLFILIIAGIMFLPEILLIIKKIKEKLNAKD